MAAVRLTTVPLFGSGVASKSFVSTRQRRLNVYFEIREDGDKSRFAVFGTPGLNLTFQAANSVNTVRGMLGTPAALYVVASNKLQIITAIGPPLVSTTAPGFLATLGGLVTVSTNNTQVLMADGNTGVIYNVANNTMNNIGGSFPNGAQTITFVSGFFVAEQPGSQQFWTSNANDGSTWGGLNFATANAYPGYINAVDNLNGNLILFSTDHLEFWQNIGSAPEPFAPITSASREYGLAAVFSRAHIRETICFLAQNREGQVQIAQIVGYDLKIISTPDIDSIINGFDVVSDAVALAYGIDAHKFYQITFPTANRSFLFDASTQLWSEVQTGVTVAPTRHIGNLAANFQGQTLVSDYSNNNVYTFDPESYLDNDIPIVRELVTRHVLSSFNRIRIARLYLDMETGVGLQTGQGSNPQIMLSYSKDNGRTWSGERWQSLGRVGRYRTRVHWNRFGSTYDAVFKIRMTDPVKFVITDGAMRVRERGKDPSMQQRGGPKG